MKGRGLPTCPYDAGDHEMANRRTVVRCFQRGRGGMKLTGTTFAAGGRFAESLSVFAGFDSAHLLLRSGLIRGIGLVCCCLVIDEKVGGEVFLHHGEHPSGRY